MRETPRLLSALALGLLASACSPVVEWVGIRLLYDEAPRAERVLREVGYRPGSSVDRHRLDLYLPAGKGWPLLVFVPGGGWTSGNKALQVAGADVYGNIGRFYAAHGIATAVVNYRLQPEVTWREQVSDVAHALAWARSRALREEGDAGRLFLAGHSAGAQLSTFVALSPGPLGEVGLSPRILCGVIPVSGAGYDLADETTYLLGADPSYYEERFRGGDPGDSWLREASAIRFVSADSPPFLLIHGSREWRSLGHQNRRLDRALRAAGVASRLVVARQGHGSMVLALSHEGKLPSRETLRFIHETRCPQPPPDGS